ncbi:formin-binding protein 1-like isoform X2 [Pomacea canaliculata]|uniref:formin-binding protein 1-like isoform X2 n=1 Tax=Pomacea canaliculata TaxID=400727 RepID=UPI000D72F68D|nr:formin-binding protein 1-like isoform X2 [Pomacea canaliculata]
MSWGTELWDQYDNVGVHTQKGIDFCEKFTHFLKERSAVELEYARNLKKLVKNFQPKKREEDEYQFTWAKGFVDMIKEVHDIAGQHEVIAESLQGTVYKDLQNLMTELKQDRKKHLQEGARLQEQLRQMALSLDKAKKTYEKAFKESERALDNYRKADADINLSRADVEKQRIIMNQKAQQCEDCKNEYASVLQQFNSHQQEHYHTAMPMVFQQLQEMETKRITKMKDCVLQCAEIEKSVIPIINTCIEGMIKAAGSVNSAQDSKLVIDKYKSGFPIPQDVPFEDLSNMGGMVDNQNNSTSNKQTPSNPMKPSTVSSKQKKRGGLFGLFGSSKIIGLLGKVDDQKEDFSDLPPNQRRRKLQQKIDLIKKDMAKETAEREGILKLKDVYVSNPALGDPNMLAEKVEENAQKLDALQQELLKYEGYLAECEGKRRHSASGDSIHSSDSGHHAPHTISTPGTPHQQPHNVYAPIDGDEDGDEFGEGDVEFHVIGTCRALYPFEATNEGSVPMSENEEMQILEEDQGDGWTRVRKVDGTEGFVPSSYVQCHYLTSD